MPTFEFKQHDVEIKDPTVVIDEDSIRLQISRNTISVEVTLETADAVVRHVLLEDIPVANFCYEGAVNLQSVVDTALLAFAKKTTMKTEAKTR